MSLVKLIQNFRENGHYVALVDPLFGKSQLKKSKNHSGWHIPYAPDLAKLLRNYPKLDLHAVGLGDFAGQQFDIGSLITSTQFGDSKRLWTPEEVVHYMRACYCNTSTVEYMHITNEEQRHWIRKKFDFSEAGKLFDKPMPRALGRLPLNVERSVVDKNLSANERRARAEYLELLFRSHHLELFLAEKYPSSKRFGLAGCESLIPGLKALFDHAGHLGIENIQLGMAHRGRLNVLVNLLQKPLESVCAEFGGTSAFSLGDVRYHLGTHAYLESSGVTVDLVPNPSHLEMVNPVVIGKARAVQHFTKDRERKRTMPLLIHGDAAFSGQGIVSETLELSELSQYTVGGTVHIIVNNRIGYTTDPGSARSSPWPTNMAKGVGEGIPVFHVNGDDVEAVMWCMETAVNWRQTFGKDVIVDVVCFRRHGHDDLEKPTISNPYTYKHVQTQTPVVDLYVDELLKSGAADAAELSDVERDILDEYRATYDAYVASEEEKKGSVERTADDRADWISSLLFGEARRRPNPTAVPIETLRLVGTALTRLPDDESFRVHDDVRAILKRRATSIETGEGIDMATAEALAFGTLLLKYEPGDDVDYWTEDAASTLQEAGNAMMLRTEKSLRSAHADVHVRLSGQDCERGTFNQRHAVLVSQNVDKWITAHRGERPRLKVGRRTEIYTPLNNLVVGRNAGQSEFMVCNSSLSEAAILAFEYGYSLENENTLVAWEAQFGDFANNAQGVIDEMVVSGEQKWGPRAASSLVLLLPHGLEGFGPDHSSCRPERFLQMVNDDEDVLPGAMSACQLSKIESTFESCVPDARGRVSVTEMINALASESRAVDRPGGSPELARLLTKRFVAEQLRKGHIFDAQSFVTEHDSIYVDRRQWIEFFSAWRRRVAEADRNIRVVNCTTPSNLFHVLREQIHRTFLKPLVICSPKWLHTHRYCRSNLADMSHGSGFERVILDGCVGDNVRRADAYDEIGDVDRLVFCTGKIYYHLAAAARRKRRSGKRIRVARLEQIAPYPHDDFMWAVSKHPTADIVWVQEEPKNQGAWTYVRPRADTCLRELRKRSAVGDQRIRYIGRGASAAPATGSAVAHHAELREIISEVFS